MPRADENRQLSRQEYWDGRYEAREEHEWFCGFAALRPLLERLLQGWGSGVRILHLGCGTSTLTADLHALGYRAQLNVDFSPSAIAIMSARHAGLEGVEWRVADVRRMGSVGDGTIDFALDKGTLDAMIYGSLWDPEAEVKANVGAYVDEVARVLASKGTFLYVTFRQPHFMKPLLTRERAWTMDVQTLQATKGAFEYFAYIMTRHEA